MLIPYNVDTSQWNIEVYNLTGDDDVAMRQETTGNEWESKQFFKKNFSEFDFIGEDGRDQWEAADQSQLQVRLLTVCIVLLVWPHS